jgi:NAD(P)-dependent dehydrogenase (short-subunit alcohol dehydrogenase family)
MTTASQQVAVITGASSGIGKAAARQLAALGWRVIGIGRDPQRCAAAEAEIRAAAADGASVEMIRADLGSLAETARVADEIAARTDRVDALLNNAGGVVGEYRLTPEGHEATFASNHLAPFLLTRKLMPLLEATAAKAGAGKVRVIGVSSSGHRQCQEMNWDDLGFSGNYSTGAAYCQAKLANILFTRELARRAAAAGIVAHAMHPGVVASNFGADSREMAAYMQTQTHRADTPEQAAQTLVWLATAEEPGNTTGGYWHQRAEEGPASQALDDDAARRLWEKSEQMVRPY